MLPRQSSYYDDDGYRPQNGVRHGSVPDGKIGTPDGLNGRSATANGEPRPLSIASGDRPSTSPNARHSLSRTFFEDYDDDEMEYMWPQPPKRNDRFNSRVTDFGTSSLERENGLKTRSRKPSTDSFKERAALGTRGYAEDEAAREREREKEKELERGPKSPSLNLNTFNLETPKLNDQSWFLSSATPLTATTPTVTLQRDGHDAVLLNHDDNSKRDNDDESIEEDEEEEEEDDDDSIIKNLDIAQKIFNGDESIVAKDKAAAWLGDPYVSQSDAWINILINMCRCPERTNIRKVYMSLYDWSGVNILSALRIFCGRLVFKGEAQQVDRIMDEIAKRWCECNPNHGFKSSGRHLVSVIVGLD